jgi:hypothetical protein
MPDHMLSTNVDAENIREVVSLLFVCFPGVTTHCGCIFTAR